MLKFKSSPKVPIGKSGSSGKVSPSSSPKELSIHLERLSLGPRSGITVNELDLDFASKKKLLQGQMQGMIENLEQECCKIIFDVFPEKIQLLDEMYKNRKEFNLSKNEIVQTIDFQEPTGSDEEIKRKLSRIQVPANKALCDLFSLLQKEILDMSEMINSLSIWVKLNVPRMADGNNFGVEVQQEISSVLESTEVSGYEILDSFTSYHTARANLVTQIIKFPGIEDFRESLKELDEKTYIKTSLLACELRNDYITLYDMLSKNMDTLTTPRGQENERLARMY